jgi:hypothetical protein
MAYVGTSTAGLVMTGNGTSSLSVYSAIGTNSGLTSKGVLIAQGNGAFQALAVGTAGQALQSKGAALNPAYSTPTYPSTASTAGKVLISDGNNILNSTPYYPNTPGVTGQTITSDGTGFGITTATYAATTTINRIRYSSANNTTAGLTTANNATLVTDGSGVPSISATLPTAVQGNITSTGNVGNQTNTTRCAFLYYVPTTVTNVTGNSTVYTLGTDALTQKYDQGSNCTTGGLFTAPVTGKYLLGINVIVTGTTIASTTNVTIVTTSKTFSCLNSSVSASVNIGSMLSKLASMTAGDTATFTVASGGEGSNTDDVLGVSGSIISSYLYGALIC